MTSMTCSCAVLTLVAVAALACYGPQRSAPDYPDAPRSDHVDDYFGVDEKLNFRDLDVLAVGPAAKEAGDAFDMYWNSPAAVPITVLLKETVTDGALELRREDLRASLEEMDALPYTVPKSENEIGQTLERLAEELVWAETEVIIDSLERFQGGSESAFVEHDGRCYAEGRRYMTWDINACAAGCFEGGASRVWARDGHAGGLNVLWPELDARIELVQGAGNNRRMPGLEECDALILLGYHAMAGTRFALSRWLRKTIRTCMASSCRVVHLNRQTRVPRSSGLSGSQPAALISWTKRSRSSSSSQG